MLARIFLVCCFAIGLSACATQVPVAFSANDACSDRSTFYGAREIQCQLPKTGFTGKLRIKVNFSGGHDDTSARMETFIDDAPLACDEGSKTYLSQEDGNVSLWCSFSVPHPIQGKGVFKAAIRWGHAEYVDYEMAVQR